MQITIDRGGCIGCGLCEVTCPAVFRIAADGLAEVCCPPADDAARRAARTAAEQCPVSVIHIQD